MDIVQSLQNSQYAKDIHIHVDDKNDVWFCAKDVANVVGIKCIHSVLRFYHLKDKTTFRIDTNGGPQKVMYISPNGLKQLLFKSRRPEADNLAIAISIDLNNIKYTCVESDVLKAIEETFDGEEMVKQYRIGKYYIDLYMPKYNLAIECDEIGHRTKLEKDNDREAAIRELNPGITFIRAIVYAKDFNVYKTLNKIYTHISKGRQI